MANEQDDRELDLWEAFPPPKPTGNTHVWYVDRDLLPVIDAIKDQMEWAMSRRDVEAYGLLREQLVTLPGHPKVQEGDHIEIRVRAPLIITSGYGH